MIQGNIRTILWWVWTVVFLAVMLFHVFACYSNIQQLPEGFPDGGPDEPMHRSMSRYIAKHLSWPHWDSEELKRYPPNGNSYATGSSWGYWLEAMLLRTTGKERLSGLVLLIVCLSIVTSYHFRNPLVGLIGLALLIPQFVFIHSYVNADAWLVLISLLLGLAVARFWREPIRTWNIVFLLTAAAACITCRQHMWLIGFLAFAYVLLPRLRLVVRQNPRALALSLVPALIVGSWWPVTSYFANDGDVIGLTAAAKAQAQFGEQDKKTRIISLREINVWTFPTMMAKSFYSYLGWSAYPLHDEYYLVALAMGVPLIGLLWWRLQEFVPLYVLLLVVNFSLILYRSVTYDYQPQGRYMYPAYFVMVGMMLQDIYAQWGRHGPHRFPWFLLYFLLGFITLNLHVLGLFKTLKISLLWRICG